MSIITMRNESVNRNKNIWIFQGNPKKYRIVDALADGFLDGWRVTRYEDKIKFGDIGLIWICGQSAGIYAVADITSNPTSMPILPEEEKYFIEKIRAKEILAVGLKFTHYLLNYPIYRYELKDLPGLENLSIIKCAMGTNFPVEESEWQIIRQKIDEHSGRKS